MPIVRNYLALFALLLNACSGIPANRNANKVGELLNNRGGDEFAQITESLSRDKVDHGLQLSQPLTADSAVRFALVNNPQLKSAYARLGLVAADVYDAARLANPRVVLATLDSSASGNADQISLSLTQNFANLILLKARTAQAKVSAERNQFIIAAEIFNLAQDVRRAYYDYVGAKQMAALQQLTVEAMKLSVELTTRYFRAGNVNRLELSLALAAASEAELNAVIATATERAKRIELSRILGLVDDGSWQAQDGLPLPLSREDALAELQQLANLNRLDLQAAHAGIALEQSALGMTRRFRYLGELELGVEYERETDHSRLLGPSMTLELPMFNQGSGKVLRAAAKLEQRQALTDSLGLAIANSVALARNQVLSAREQFEIYQTQFVPARQNIVHRTRELESYMLVSPFESLRAKRAEYDAYAGSIRALRDYWLARVALTRATGASLPSARRASFEPYDLNALMKIGPSSHQHHKPSTQPSATGDRQ